MNTLKTGPRRVYSLSFRRAVEIGMREIIRILGPETALTMLRDALLKERPQAPTENTQDRHDHYRYCIQRAIDTAPNVNSTRKTDNEYAEFAPSL